MALCLRFHLTSAWVLILCCLQFVLADAPEKLVGIADFYEHSKDDPPKRFHYCPLTELASSPEAKQCAAPDSWFPLEGDYKPWTQRPWCVKSRKHLLGKDTDVETFCIFAKADFAEGRGITLVTTPRQAKYLAGLSAFTNPDIIQGVNDLITGGFGPPPYVSHRFPDKGIGLVANRSIARGERIMHETVPWVYNRDMFNNVPDEDRIPLQWMGLYSLPKESREEVLALHTTHGGDSLDDVMRTNAFGAYYADDELHNNVLPRISRFNHDCRPK
jgi:hypothetical protein